MKKIKYLGLFLLIIFTFVYTDKVISVINDNDSIMLEIKEQAKYYKTDPVNATIIDDTIIPGINGREIDIQASYNSMKHGKVFNPSLLRYKVIYPEYSIRNNLDKFVIHGNSKNKNVSIIYILNNNSDILLSSLNDDIVINIFVNYGYLEHNMNNLTKFKNHEIYNYGDNGKYTNENIIMGNNIINNKSSNKSIYCLSTQRDIDVLNICSSNKMWTIMPSFEGGYLDVKNNISNGSIILLDNISELNSIKSYLTDKGYNVLGLSNLLSENID